jgi:hypothetical protein
MDKVLAIQAEQDGKLLPMDIKYDRQIWSGLSWGAGEIREKDLNGRRGPIRIRCSSVEKDARILEGRVYAVEY